MPYRLRYESVDDDPEVREFSSIDDAVEFAEAWFMEGYTDENDDVREMARDHLPGLRTALRSGETFICKIFCEEMSVERI